MLTFDTSTISEEIEIGYMIEKVEQYVPACFRYHKCHKGVIRKYIKKKKNCKMSEM